MEDVVAPEREPFEVDLPVFSGPFRLLASLILEQKVDVCDVALARVTDAYLQRGMTEMLVWSLEEATWFLAACAALLELKVGRLLPRAAPDAEEELLGGVSPDLVYARSLELRAFRRVAEDLAALLAEGSLRHTRPPGVPKEFAHLYPDPMERVTAAALAQVAAEVLRPPPILDISHVTPIRVTLADAVRAIEDQLAERPSTRFRDLVGDCEARIEIVIRFLALLELHRQGKVDLRQAGPLGDIEVRRAA
jgi:segregation and condensation protein A